MPLLVEEMARALGIPSSWVRGPSICQRRVRVCVSQTCGTVYDDYAMDECRNPAGFAALDLIDAEIERESV